MTTMRGVFLFLLFVSLRSSSSGQNLDIGGQILAKETNQGIAGATIRVKGTHFGTTSDANGNFKLSLAGRTEAILSISCIGFKTIEQTVTSSVSDLKINLQEDVLKTSEVVVTGFASTVKRENAANTVATVTSKELLPAPAQTLEQALAGKFAGINVSQNTGAPGGGIDVMLRGVSTIEGSTQPLYVVDGVIVNNAATQSGIDIVTRAPTAGNPFPQGQPVNRIADINPNDIASVEVLKGASAAALYGSKATNGVIIINTKQGTLGTPRLDITHQVGVNSILNKIGTRSFTRETAKASYGAVGESLFVAGGGQYIDYEDVMYGEKGLINETSVSTSGGTEKTQYFASGLFRDENGIISRTGYKKYSGRFNLNHTLSERVKITAMMNFMKTESDRAITGNDNTNTTLGFSLAFTPSFLDIRPQNGVYPSHPFNPSNPIETRDLLTNNEQVFRSIGSLGLNWNILLEENHFLDFVAQSGVDFYSQENKVIAPPELQFERNSSNPGASVLGETRSTNANLYLSLVHGYTSSSNNNFKTSTGVQIENQDMNNVLDAASGLIVTQTNIDQASSLNGFQHITKQRELGLYVQEEANFNENIYLTAGLRGDASSVNGDPNKFYLFPKAAGSIRLSRYPFWEGLGSAISEFKLRAAYGETGNLAPADAKFTSLIPANTGGLGGLIPGTRRGASDVRPERTKELETGIDATFLNERATLEATYFRKNISDLILIHTLPPSSGFVDEYINAGQMRTQGVELSLGATPVRNEGFAWTSRLNFYKYSSEITALDVPAFNKGGFATFLGTYRIEEGLSPTTIVGAEKDANGKFKKLGDETPDFQMSLNTTITMGSFELGFLWEWKQGGNVINLGKLITDLGGTTADYDELGVFNVNGKDTTLKKGPGRLAVLGAQTAPYIEDGTYLKLRELHLTWSVGQDLVNSLFGGQFHYLRLGLTARNLLMFTKYSGYDPEVSQFGNLAIGRSVDTLPFPSSRSYYFDIAFGI
jgi:TonB-linked SusC/RagA family outer membrane protein